MDIFMKRFDCDDATKAFGNIWWDVTFIIHTNIFIFIIRQFDEKSCKLGKSHHRNNGNQNSFDSIQNMIPKLDVWDYEDVILRHLEQNNILAKVF